MPFVVVMVPAPGRSVVGLARISAMTGLATAFSMRTRRDAALAVLRGSMPVGSTTVTPGTPCFSSQLRAALAYTASLGHSPLARRSA